MKSIKVWTYRYILYYHSKYRLKTTFPTFFPGCIIRSRKASVAIFIFFCTPPPFLFQMIILNILIPGTVHCNMHQNRQNRLANCHLLHDFGPFCWNLCRLRFLRNFISPEIYERAEQFKGRGATFHSLLGATMNIPWLYKPTTTRWKYL